jgi:hypothetical protein
VDGVAPSVRDTSALSSGCKPATGRCGRLTVESRSVNQAFSLRLEIVDEGEKCGAQAEPFAAIRGDDLV